MTYHEARKKIFIYWLLGAPILIGASISSIISILKMFYFGFDDGNPLSGAIARFIRHVVHLAYEHTHVFLDFFWTYSPIPAPKNLLSNGTIASFVIYLGIFFGMALIKSARALSARLAKIDIEVENQLIKESIRGSVSRRRDEIQAQIMMPKPGFFSQFQTLYLAPIITGLIVAVIVKISGLA